MKKNCDSLKALKFYFKFILFSPTIVNHMFDDS